MGFSCLLTRVLAALRLKESSRVDGAYSDPSSRDFQILKVDGCKEGDVGYQILLESSFVPTLAAYCTGVFQVSF